MRCQVYRNLDKPFQILGFTSLELTALCFVLVGGTEVARIINVQRSWAFVVAAVLALCFFWIHKSLGELFVRRFFRFLSLPNQMYPRLLVVRKAS